MRDEGGAGFISASEDTIMHTKKQQQLPQGIVDSKDGYHLPSMDSIWCPDGDKIEAGRHHQNTFEVVPKHELIPGVGAIFNVETVPEPLPTHKQMQAKDRASLFEKLKQDSAAFYSKGRSDGQIVDPAEIKLEAVFNTAEQNIVYAGGNGFLVACMTAFAQHLPLQLTPDDIWSLISYTFAKHVDENAEELRSMFVQHQGKKRLLVETPVTFQMSSNGNPDTGASAREWEGRIFPDFSQQIREHVGSKVHDSVTADFSTTSAPTKAAAEITLMAAMKNYFSYGMSTMCGIPKITLAGTEEDWVALRNRAEELGSLMTSKFSQYWMPLLLPVLDECVDSYKGNVNHGFWQSMVKLRNNGMGSGYEEYISGWMQIFFPYLASGRMNERLRPWNEMYFQGPSPKEFPTIVSSAPVDWNYFGTTYDLDFHAGITGFGQDPSEGTIRPVVGWYVTHAPPKPADERLEDVKAEIEALLKGHEEEAKADVLDETQPWFERVSALRREQAELEQEVKTMISRKRELLW